MSTSPKTDETSETDNSQSKLRIRELFVSLDSGVSLARSNAKSASQSKAEEFLRQFLGNLCVTSGASAAILWIRHQAGLRWSASQGIDVENSHRESPYTNDVISNVDQVFSHGETDIFTCDTAVQDQTPVSDPKIKNLVLNCRQLLLPLRRNDKTFAVIVLFQPADLSETELWALDDLVLLQRGLNERIRSIERASTDSDLLNETSGTRCNTKDEPASDVGARIKSPLERLTVSQQQATRSTPESDNGLRDSIDTDSENRLARTEQKSVDSDPLAIRSDQSSADTCSKDVSYIHPVSRTDDSSAIPISEKHPARSSHVGKVSTEELTKALALNEVVGSHLHEVDCAFDIANEVYSFLGEGRVSVAVFRGNSCRIKAVSNQQVFDRRSGTILAIERLATTAARTRRPWFHPDQDSRLPDRLRSDFDRYYEQADTQSIALLPLTKKTDANSDPDDLAAILREGKSNEGKLVGVLVVEGLRSPIDLRKLQQRWELVERPVANALANSHQHNSLFLMPVWRELGKFTDLFRGHRRNKTFAIAAVAACIALALWLVPGEMKLSCEGVIQPTLNSKVFAQTEGVVEQILVQDGDWVEQGQVLLTLENPELLADIAKVEGELRETTEKLKTLKLQRMQDQFSTPEERRQAILTSSGYDAKLQKLREQFELLEEKKTQLTVLSPVAGRVVTWDTERRLMSRPIEIGQNLLTIADARGPWELELRLADKRSGYLQTDVKDPTRVDEDSPKLKTSFVVASNPTEVKYGYLREVAKSAEVDEELGNIVRVYVDLEENPAQDARVRPGTEVLAHIHVGKASIGYCKLYEFFDWLNRTWFRLT